MFGRAKKQRITTFHLRLMFKMYDRDFIIHRRGEKSSPVINYVDRRKSRTAAGAPLIFDPQLHAIRLPETL